MSKRSLKQLDYKGSSVARCSGNPDGSPSGGDSEGGPRVAGLDRVTGKTVPSVGRAKGDTERGSGCEDDFFSLEDLEIWSLLPEAVSVVENSLLGELSVDIQGRGGNCLKLTEVMTDP